MFQGILAEPGLLRCFVVCAVTACTSSAFAGAPRLVTRQFPPGSLTGIEDLPASRFRAQLERLPGPARERALRWLRAFHFTEQDLKSLQTDPEGGIFYADSFTVPASEPQDAEPGIAAAAVPVTPFPASLVFHSRPGAPNVLFLNFCGEDVVNTAWNTSLSRTAIPAVAFSTDADFTTFSDAEQLVIKRIWERVSEDYAPFNIDVTTERPSSFTSRTGHALVTRSTDANGEANPSSGSGGVAYISVFGSSSYANYRPAWVYYNNLGNNEAYVAEAVSHEVGHNMGLSHDGCSDGTEYYGGHGSGDISWGPIMGASYNRNVSQWSRGEYYLADNTEDDLSMLSGLLTYRGDDHGNTIAAATALRVTDSTNIVSTTPETDPSSTNRLNKGMLERVTDVDFFSFTTGSGAVDLTVNPWVQPSGSRGGNADVVAELYDAAGVLLLTNNGASVTFARLQTNLAEGLYYVKVRGTGAGNPLGSAPTGYTSYASLGQYFISGKVVSSSFITPPRAELAATDVAAPGQASAGLIVTYTDNVAVDVSTLGTGDLRVTGPGGYDRIARLLSFEPPVNGSPVTAMYAADAPDGAAWLPADNGTYSVWLGTNQVGDTEGAWVAAGKLGEFSVAVPAVIYRADMDTDPGWMLEPQWEYGRPAYILEGPTGGATGVNILAYNLDGYYERTLSSKYATTPAIDCRGAEALTLRFQRWLGLKRNARVMLEVSTNGMSWVELWSADTPMADASWCQVEHALPAWTAGAPALRLRWGISSASNQQDIGWNIDDVQVVGSRLAPAPIHTLTVSANNSAWGSASPASGSYSAGTVLQLSATPAQWFRFVNWTGDVSAAANPFSVAISNNMTVQAVFAEVLTTNHPTPVWWLASLGYNDNFEAAVDVTGANGLPLWESYVAGLDPNDAGSRVELSISFLQWNGDIVLSWTTVTGRLYSVECSTNVLAGFQALGSGANMTSEITSLTNSRRNGLLFYRLKVQKQ